MKGTKLSVLFFLIHPAKFHQCRITINYLIAKGHKVEIIILGRDILEELVINEGWEYKLIFPNGRKFKGVHTYISSALLFFPTIFKLFWLTLSKKYDLFINDDLLSYVGFIRRIPSIFLIDDDLSAVPQAHLYLISVKHIFAPDVCYLGRYKKRAIGYYGYKSLAHLHPNSFKPDRTKIEKRLRTKKPFFFIRTVMANSKHDSGKSSISDIFLRKLVNRLKKEGNIVLNSERELPEDLKKYQLNHNKNDVAHYLYYAKIVIGDSTTMAVEAAVLGTPSIEIDDWYSDFQQYKELNGKYRLMQGFDLDDEEGVINLLDEYLAMEDLDTEFQKRRQIMLADKIDVSAFLIWIIENYPVSINEYRKNPDIQLNFKSNA